jgi:hypothetical protein
MLLIYSLLFCNMAQRLTWIPCLNCANVESKVSARPWVFKRVNFASHISWIFVIFLRLTNAKFTVPTRNLPETWIFKIWFGTQIPPLPLTVHELSVVSPYSLERRKVCWAALNSYWRIFVIIVDSRISLPSQTQNCLIIPTEISMFLSSSDKPKLLYSLPLNYA